MIRFVSGCSLMKDCVFIILIPTLAALKCRQVWKCRILKELRRYFIDKQCISNQALFSLPCIHEINPYFIITKKVKTGSSDIKQKNGKFWKPGRDGKTDEFLGFTYLFINLNDSFCFR